MLLRDAVNKVDRNSNLYNLLESAVVGAVGGHISGLPIYDSDLKPNEELAEGAKPPGEFVDAKRYYFLGALDDKVSKALNELGVFSGEIDTRVYSIPDAAHLKELKIAMYLKVGAARLGIITDIDIRNDNPTIEYYIWTLADAAWLLAHGYTAIHADNKKQKVVQIPL